MHDDDGDGDDDDHDDDDDVTVGIIYHLLYKLINWIHKRILIVADGSLSLLLLRLSLVLC